MADEKVERGTQPVGGAEAIHTDISGMPDYDAASVTVDSPARGGGFTTDQLDILRRIINQLRSNCQPWCFYYYNDGVPITEDTFLTLPGGIVPTADIMGAIPHRNGFIDGYGVCCEQQMDQTDAINFVLYRDGVESRCEMLVSAWDNKDDVDTSNVNGVVRARLFNTNPGLYTITHENDVYPFRAQERLTVRATASTLPGHTFPDNIDNLIFYLYPVFEIWTPETSVAQDLGGGLPDNIPGGEADVERYAQEGGGGGGFPPIL